MAWWQENGTCWLRCRCERVSHVDTTHPSFPPTSCYSFCAHKCTVDEIILGCWVWCLDFAKRALLVITRHPGVIYSPGTSVQLICWLCAAHCISLLPMCVYSTYTQHSWSFLCKLFNKSGQRINTRQSNSEHQRSAACFFFFFLLPSRKKPSASHGDYDRKMTNLAEWQKYLHPAN